MRSVSAQGLRHRGLGYLSARPRRQCDGRRQRHETGRGLSQLDTPAGLSGDQRYVDSGERHSDVTSGETSF